MNTLQENIKQVSNVLNIFYYKSLKNYLDIFGINPYQNKRISFLLLFISMFVSISVIIPMAINFYMMIIKKEFDGAIEGLPSLVAQMGIVTNIMNITLNKDNFRTLFDMMLKRWKTLEVARELEVLQHYTKKGTRLREFYKDLIWLVLFAYISLPFINPMLDLVLPLNETRPRKHLFPVDYLYIDTYKHFYAVNAHLYTTVVLGAMIVMTADMLYIAITYHLCGLFAICRDRIQVTTESNIRNKHGETKFQAEVKEFKQCVTMHYEALHFHRTFEKSSRYMYLLQVGLCVFIISVTITSCVVHIDKPDELVRLAMFVAGQNFHLLVLNLPGQLLLDESIGLADILYGTNWYKLPTKEQKMIYMMQIRTIRPCMLSAGGLCNMNIESFGVFIKACMSYFMMFMSFKG